MTYSTSDPQPHLAYTERRLERGTRIPRHGGYMKKAIVASWALLAGLAVSAGWAQDTVDIGFKSVGRGAPLGASVQTLPLVGPNWVRRPDSGEDVSKAPINGFRPDALPKTYKPLPRDIYTSDDFYADKALWKDPRYFRCGSPISTEYQRGILTPPGLITSAKTADGVWGHCEADFPRKAIVSPYGFKTAQEHYEALLAETRKRGGPNKYTFKDFPAADWNGMYMPPRQDPTTQQTWYWGTHSQVSTILSLLTPEYQERMVQEAYHQVRGHAMWPSTFCWPEGFMRRFYPSAVREHYMIATPEMMQLSMGVARNFVTNVHIGREFNLQDVAAGGVPRLGAAVPRWYGETVGFWDGEALITWTSNVQGWKSHSLPEFSSKIQSVEIYTAIRDKSGKFIGVNHEAVFYDPESLVEPIRIVRNLHRVAAFSDAKETPQTFIECVQTIFSVDGENAPLTPGNVIQYEMPDMYNRPWSAVWRKYFEKGMSKKDDSEDIFNFDSPAKK